MADREYGSVVSFWKEMTPCLGFCGGAFEYIYVYIYTYICKYRSSIYIVGYEVFDFLIFHHGKSRASLSKTTYDTELGSKSHCGDQSICQATVSPAPKRSEMRTGMEPTALQAAPNGERWGTFPIRTGPNRPRRAFFFAFYKQR